MISSRIPKTKITMHDLQPGDIIIWPFFGAPHCAIYSPKEGKQADLIHLYFYTYYDPNKYCGLLKTGRLGICKTTLSHPMTALKEDEDIIVIRSRVAGEGQAIADQAEFWLRQGVRFDVVRLTDTLSNISFKEESPSVAENILQYLKYGARRGTKPVKSRDYPYDEMDYVTAVGLMMSAPSMSFFKPVTKLGSKLVHYMLDTPGRQKGLTCGGFVLATIAAVKLRNEIGVVNKETGWVSLKYSSQPEGQEDGEFSQLLQHINKETGMDASQPAGPGLDAVLTPEQIAGFNVERLYQILTPAIAETSPHLPNVDKSFKRMLDDPRNWQCLGRLDRTVILRKYDPDEYKLEHEAQNAEVRDNQAAFLQEFGEEIFDRPRP